MVTSLRGTTDQDQYEPSRVAAQQVVRRFAASPERRCCSENGDELTTDYTDGAMERFEMYAGRKSIFSSFARVLV